MIGPAKTRNQCFAVGRNRYRLGAPRISADCVTKFKCLCIPELVGSILRAADGIFAIGRVLPAIDLGSMRLFLAVQHLSSLGIPENELADISGAAEKLFAVGRNRA